MTNICTVPDCTNKCQEYMTVCKKHRHVPIYCECRKCRAASFEERPVRRGITLPPMPWEVQNG